MKSYFMDGEPSLICYNLYQMLTAENPEWHSLMSIAHSKHFKNLEIL